MKQSGYLVKITAFLPTSANSPSDMADAAANVAELTRDMEGRGFVDVALVSRFVMQRRGESVAAKPADALAELQAAKPDVLQAAKSTDDQLAIPTQFDRRTQAAE